MAVGAMRTIVLRGLHPPMPRLPYVVTAFRSPHPQPASEPGAAHDNPPDLTVTVNIQGPPGGSGSVS
jgi:hypothetical protein